MLKSKRVILSGSPNAVPVMIDNIKLTQSTTSNFNDNAY
jgi:hypothetical protein